MKIVVKFAHHLQASLGRCGADHADDGRVADQWLGAPVHGDEGKQPMLSGRPGEIHGCVRQAVQKSWQDRWGCFFVRVNGAVPSSWPEAPLAPRATEGEDDTGG